MNKKEFLRQVVRLTRMLDDVPVPGSAIKQVNVYFKDEAYTIPLEGDIGVFTN